MKKEAFEQLSDFFAQYKKLHYKKGEVILRPEELPRGVFYLSKGYVRQYSVSSEGEEFTLIIFGPKDFFPIIWAINGTTFPYYLEAITPIELFCAPREDFHQFLKDNQLVLFDLTSRILTRMGGLMARMEYLVFGNAYDKVVSIISICAERFGQVSGKQVTIGFPFSHRIIGNLIGVSRETVSLEVKKLERKGLISYKNRYLTVSNIDLLSKESIITQY